MRRCSLVAERLEVGCAWCCNICGGVSRGGVGMNIIIYVWKRFEERIEMEQPPCRRDKSRCGVSLSGTAPDRHPSSVISVRGSSTIILRTHIYVYTYYAQPAEPVSQ